MFEAFEANATAFAYAVAALPVIHVTTFAIVPDELPKNVAEFAASVATLAARPAVV